MEYTVKDTTQLESYKQDEPRDGGQDRLLSQKTASSALRDRIFASPGLVG